MKGARLPPVNLNLQAKELAPALIEGLDLSVYETKILTVLLSAPRPLKAAEISPFCHVPRTKTYGAIKLLVSSGLVCQLIRTEEDLEKPDIYDYWPNKYKTALATRNNVGVKFFAPNLPYIKDLYLTWSTEYYTRKLKISQLLDLLEEQSQDIPQAQPMMKEAAL